MEVDWAITDWTKKGNRDVVQQRANARERDSERKVKERVTESESERKIESEREEKGKESYEKEER